VYLADVVLAEVASVLRGYDLDRQTRHALQDRLVRTRGAAVAHRLDRQAGAPGHLADLQGYLTGFEYRGHLTLPPGETAWSACREFH
jgi:hypothetical protein